MTTRQRRLLALLLLVALAAAGITAWKQTRPAPTPAVAIPPEIPSWVDDLEVRTALARAREKVEADPQSGQAWGELGLTFRAHNMNAESNSCFAVAAKLDPRNPRWPYLIGVINLLIAPNAAIPHLQSAYELATEPEHKSLTRLRLAEALLDRGDTDAAAQLFAEEALAHPLNPRVQFGLGTVAAARGDDHAAIKALMLAVDSPFTRRKSSALLAACHRRLGHTADATRFAHDASSGPDDFPWTDPILSEYTRREAGRSARMKAVEEFEASGRIREAVDALDDIARTTPDDQVLVALGINLAKLGDYGRSERALRAVVDRSPAHAVARYFLGLTQFLRAEQLRERGEKANAAVRYEAAIAEFRRAVALKPDQGMSHLFIGQSLRQLGRPAEAVDACREAVRVSPQQPQTHLALGELLLELGRPAEAVPPLEAAVRLFQPPDARATQLLAKARAAVKK